VKNVPTLDLEKVYKFFLPPHLLQQFLAVFKFFDPVVCPFISDERIIMALKEADITTENLIHMIEANLVEKTLRKAVRSGVNLFCVPEKIGTGKERKRFLGWTELINEFYPLSPDESVKLPSFKQILSPVKRGTFVLCVDMSSYYNQFLLHMDLRPFFCFLKDGEVFRLKTIATGQRHCVGLAQVTSIVLTYALDNGEEIVITVYIDNVRFVGFSKESVLSCAFCFCKRCEFVSATLNEVDVRLPEHILKQNLWDQITQVTDFLGMRHNHIHATVCLQDRAVLKLSLAREEISEPSLSFERFQAIFCFLLWASRVLDFHSCDVYHVFKFLRRRSKSHSQKQQVNIWGSLSDSLGFWFDTLLANVPRNIVCFDSFPVHKIYTDASLSGWGVYGFIHNRLCIEEIVHGEPWIKLSRPRHDSLWDFVTHLPSSEVHINELELRVLLIAILFFDLSFCRIDFLIDNTTTIGVAAKGHSRNFHQNKFLSLFRAELKSRTIEITGLDYVPSRLNWADDPSRWFEGLFF